MTRSLIFALLANCLAGPAYAQHQGHAQPPQPQPQQAPRAPQPSPPRPSTAPPADAHGHGVVQAPAAPAGVHDHEAAQPPTPTASGHENADPRQPQATMDHATHSGEAVPPPEAGNELPPDAPTNHAADFFFPKGDMERARAIHDAEHGDARIAKVMANELEYARADDDDGYRWDIEAWYGGDINRVVLKTEGEGADDLDGAEVQVLYSRAVGVYTDLRMGLRYDIEPEPNRTYLTVGAQTLLPYWFEVEGALFLGERGQLLGRLEGSYDFMLTQRLVLQPNAEVNLALKDDTGIGVGSGLSSTEIGLRLRYDIKREFSPYIGVLWEKKFGDTADFARIDGEDDEETRFVAGLRAWF